MPSYLRIGIDVGGKHGFRSQHLNNHVIKIFPFRGHSTDYVMQVRIPTLWFWTLVYMQPLRVA